MQQRPLPHSHLEDGHLSLSGLQIRGHAMFSHRGMPLDSETLEYGWLFEVCIGDLTGRLTAPQVRQQNWGHCVSIVTCKIQVTRITCI